MRERVQRAYISQNDNIPRKQEQPQIALRIYVESAQFKTESR